MPTRIQRRRTAGWRMPEGTVYVGRPTKWGNPYRWSDYPTTHQIDGETIPIAPTTRRRNAVVDFTAAVKYEIGKIDYPSLDEIRRELRGKDLACWCPLPEPGYPDDCHAAVLLKIANEEQP